MTGQQRKSNRKANGICWSFENSHCGGRAVPITPSDEVCPSSFFPRTISEKMKPCNSNSEIANAREPQTTSTFSPSMSVFCPHLHQFRRDLQQQTNPELHPDSPRPFLQNFIFKGKWRLMEMAKWFPAEPTTDSVSAWVKVISSCRITLFSDTPWKSKIWLSISGFTRLIQ